MVRLKKYFFLHSIYILAVLFSLDPSILWGECTYDSAGNKSGHITQDTCWCDTSGPYYISAYSVEVDRNVILTICPGVVVQTNDGWDPYPIIVRGTLNATEAFFTNWTTIIVESGGQLNLIDCPSITGRNNAEDKSVVNYKAGSSGAVRGCIFETINLTCNSPEITIENNMFLGPDPTTTYPDRIPSLNSNTFSSSETSTIHIGLGGTVSTDASWQIMGTARRYAIDTTVTIPAGVSLGIGDGVEISTSDACVKKFL